MNDKLLILWNANTAKQAALAEVLSNPILKEAIELAFIKESPSGVNSGRSGQDELIYSAQKLAWHAGRHDIISQLNSLTHPLPVPEQGIPEAWTDRELLKHYAETQGYYSYPTPPAE